MPLMFDLAPTVEARLIAQAHARDLSTAEFIRMMLDDLESLPPDAPSAPNEVDEANEAESMTPEQVINETINAMRERQIRSRELVVQIITRKNNLQAEVDKETRMIAEYERKAESSLHDGNHDLALSFFRELRLHERILAHTRTLLPVAEDAAERVKTLIRREEERIRRLTAEAYIIIANFKQMQLENQMRQTFAGFLPDEDDEIESPADLTRTFEEWAQKIASEKRESADPAHPETENFVADGNACL